MLLKEAINIQKNNKGRIDILELLGIEIQTDFLEKKYYVNEIKKLNKGNYFISDLDGTFFRGMISKEVFSLFIKYVKKQDINNLDLELYKSFLDDNKFFNSLEQKAYNKTISYNDYINAGTFILFKYKKLIIWEDFLEYINENFHKKEMVNPFRFSLNKMRQVLEKGDNFLFISGCPNFALDIYLELLKKFIKKEFGKDYSDNIYGIGTYIGVNEDTCIGLFGKDSKDTFIKEIKTKNIITKVTGGMGDTSSDYGISYNLDKNKSFYFINPEKSVISKYDELKVKNIKYHFIFERKDLIFETKIENINIV